MKPKIESAIRFLENGGKEVVITEPSKLRNALRNEGGTHIVP